MPRNLVAPTTTVSVPRALSDERVSSNEFSEHALSIITFNYDRSLEEYLYRVLGALYNRDAEELVQGLSIIHVHGDLGPLDWESQRGRKYGGPFAMENVLPLAGRSSGGAIAWSAPP